MISNYPVRKPTRLKFFDYSQFGAYFVTMCTQDRACLFGDIVDGQMILNSNGRIVDECWRWLEEQYDHVILDEWIVMPDHLHGIVCINAPTKAPRKPLGRLIGAFKTVSSKKIHSQTPTVGGVRERPANCRERLANYHERPEKIPIWQRSFHDRIVRNENELNQIRNYIQTNPQNWP